MTDERLQQNFWLSELLRSDLAVRKGIENKPGPAELANVRHVLAPGLQRVRNLLGAPMLVTSGFRCAELNAALGSRADSQHRQGLAADFVCTEFGTAKAVARYLVDHGTELRFDQLIWEGSWVHISFVPDKPRGQVLTAHFRGGGVSYSTGLA